MSVTERTNHIAVWSRTFREVSRRMSDQKWRIVKEVIVTVVLGALAWEAMRTGYPVTSVVATGGIGIVNTVTVAQMYRAFRDVQAENREQFER